LTIGDDSSHRNDNAAQPNHYEKTIIGSASSAALHQQKSTANFIETRRMINRRTTAITTATTANVGRKLRRTSDGNYATATIGDNYGVDRIGVERSLRRHPMRR